MNWVERFWNRCKIGLRIFLNPVTLHVRFARSVAVSGNRLRPEIRAAQPSTTTKNPLDLDSESEIYLHFNEQSERQSTKPQVALIVGTGPGLGSALARRFAKAGMVVAVAARNTRKLDPLLQEINAVGAVGRAYGCDATVESSVNELLRLVTTEMGTPNLVVYNVEHFIPGTILDITTPAFEDCWRAMTLGGFLVGRGAAQQMVSRGSGTIIFTGATASLRGRADYINMAVGKFGIRALAQSMARDLGPKGIHVAHVILDGGILCERSGDSAREHMSSMFPEHIAEAYFQIHTQHSSAWTQEMDLRPWIEKF